MNTELNVSCACLRAALLVAAKREIREYLTGVHVRVRAGVPRLEACDGKTAAIISGGLENGTCRDGTVLIPRELIEQGLHGRGRSAADSIVIRIADDAVQVGNVSGRAMATIRPYPDLEALIVGTPRPVLSQYAGKVLASVTAIAAAMDTKNATVWQLGQLSNDVQSWAVEGLGCTAVVLTMPLRELTSCADRLRDRLHALGVSLPVPSASEPAPAAMERAA